MLKTAVVYVTELNGKVLAVSRKQDHSDFGLPGGKVEKGETPYEALVREMKEETGYGVADVHFITSRKDKDYNVLVYRGGIKGPLAEVTEPHIVSWAPWHVIMEGSFGEFNRNLYNLLKEVT